MLGTYPRCTQSRRKTQSHTKGLFTPFCLGWEKRIINGCHCEMSWTTTKVNVIIDTTNEVEKEKGLILPFVCISRGAS